MWNCLACEGLKIWGPSRPRSLPEAVTQPPEEGNRVTRQGSITPHKPQLFPLSSLTDLGAKEPCPKGNESDSGRALILCRLCWGLGHRHSIQKPAGGGLWRENLRAGDWRALDSHGEFARKLKSQSISMPYSWVQALISWTHSCGFSQAPCPENWT